MELTYQQVYPTNPLQARKRITHFYQQTQNSCKTAQRCHTSPQRVRKGGKRDQQYGKQRLHNLPKTQKRQPRKTDPDLEQRVARDGVFEFGSELAAAVRGADRDDYPARLGWGEAWGGSSPAKSARLEAEFLRPLGAHLGRIPYNFQRTLNQHYNYGRTYATGDEGGVVTGTYPRGGKPSLPFPYQSECWTGLEYAFARLLLDYGFKREALQVVQAIRARHDGAKRNPFNEPECGSYYARSMSAWSLVEDR